MRPRPGGRGEGGGALPVQSEGDLLQCGHDPEAVESRAAVRVSTATTLQCGHDPEAVERCPGRAGHAGDQAASMRPRPGGREKQLT